MGKDDDIDRVRLVLTYLLFCCTPSVTLKLLIRRLVVLRGPTEKHRTFIYNVKLIKVNSTIV